MTKSKFTFRDYIQNYVTENICVFKETFKNYLDRIPDQIISSKRLIQNLEINNHFDFLLFRNTYLDYYRMKLEVIRY